MICLKQPLGFQAVGGSYWSFPQTTDADVMRLIENAAARS